jgi:hypothetical protein
VPTRSNNHNQIALVAGALTALALLVTGCSKDKPEDVSARQAASAGNSAGNNAGNNAANKAAPNAAPTKQPPRGTPAEQLAARFATTSPRSHSDATVKVFNDAGTGRHNLVILGRKHASLNGKVVAQMRCQHKGRGCTEPQQSGAEAGAEFDAQPADLFAADGDVMIDGLRTAAAALKGTPVAIIADKRVRHSAVMMAVATLKHVGAVPIVAAVNAAGNVVLVARQTSGNERGAAKRAADAKGLPRQVVRVELHVDKDKFEAVLVLPAGAPEVRNALLGGGRDGVRQWADAMAAAYPTLQEAVLSLNEHASFGDTIKLLDRLRDRCGKGSTTSNCRERTPRFSVVSLAFRRAAKPAPVVVEAAPPAPAGALPAHVLLGIDRNSALMAPRVPIPHELLQPMAMPPNVLQIRPGSAPHARPNLGGPPNGP